MSKNDNPVNKASKEAFLFDDENPPESENEFDCTIERTRFFSEQTGYGVFTARADGKSEVFTITGILPVRPGLRIHTKGEWVEHKTYGIQFRSDAFEIIIPTEADGIRKYLSSGIIRGIGKKSAKKIVDHFGDDTLKILDEDPNKVREVPGIPMKKADTIVDHWTIDNEKRSVMVFLGQNGLSLTFADRIVNKYGSGSLLAIKTNPYTLSEDISGIGFITADALASRMGIVGDNPHRIRSGIRYTFDQMTIDGNTFTTRENLVSSAANILEVSQDKVSEQVDSMIVPALSDSSLGYLDLVEENGAIYSSFLYHAEKRTAEMLVALLKAEPSKKVSPDSLDFSRLQSSAHIEYDENQKLAIQTAVNNKVTVITGGPGTGKTTITNGIIKIFKEAKMSILLAAPTGRAAKRMAEATHLQSSTIHRLLEADASGFGKNEDSQLSGDVLIIDESSMIDQSLIFALLKAIPLGMRLIIIGDVDQLPSVGCGNVLRDIIDSQVIPTVRLKKIYRQGSGSRIIDNAHLINEGKMPNLSNGMESDFFFIRKTSSQEIQDTIVDLVINRLPSRYGINPKEIQVLSPQRKTAIGVGDLNNILQSRINPGELCYKADSFELRVGDKVLQTRNDRDKGVFNGDIGIISEFHNERSEDDTDEKWVIVTFDDKKVKYEMNDLDALELAYATTVHKSQGSEYPMVIIPVSTAHYSMLKRNLLYTAVTRAKDLCILVGTEDAIRTMVSNNDIEKRNTRLKERLIFYQ